MELDQSKLVLFKEVLDLYKLHTHFDTSTAADLTEALNKPHRIMDRGYVVEAKHLVEAIVVYSLCREEQSPIS